MRAVTKRPRARVIPLAATQIPESLLFLDLKLERGKGSVLVAAVTERLTARQAAGAVQVGLVRLQGDSIWTAGRNFGLIHIFAC